MGFQEFGRAVFILFLAILTLNEIANFFRGKSSKNWKPVLAKVLDVGIHCKEDEGTEESKPFIKYQYGYLGRIYTGSKVKFGDLWSSSYGNANKPLSGIVKGSEITVYVNPRRPNQSVLYRGYEGNIFWQLGCVVVILVIAAIS